ncbi:hypothetical protein N9O27_00905 [Flavobacteriaceae bacterium]|nr:hypothetical protein [Flavobacteriaceae bacterium]
MRKGLIGFTGFVGSNILKSEQFDELYNSKNINDIEGENFDLLYCAGVPAVKWFANSNPKEDLTNISNLINSLREVNASKFILISTYDVYKSTVNVDEDSLINLSGHHPYGVHRRILELFVKEKFEDYLIIRLPALFGKGLKKNIIYDFMNDNQINKIHSESKHQFYNLNDLTSDINLILKKNIKLINLVTEPIKVREIANYCFNVDFNNYTESEPDNYNISSKYRDFYRTKTDILNQIRHFIKSTD